MSAYNYKRISTQTQRTQANYHNNYDFEATVKNYVNLMKQTGILSIVKMNNYITKNNLWDKFTVIQRLNTFESGFSSVGVSKAAYTAIGKLYKTTDVVKSHLINSTRMHQKRLSFA